MQMIKELLASKKAAAMVVGFIVTVLSIVGLDLDPLAVTQVVSPILAYIVAQGFADSGKEAAKIHAATAKDSATTSRQLTA